MRRLVPILAVVAVAALLGACSSGAGSSNAGGGGTSMLPLTSAPQDSGFTSLPPDGEHFSGDSDSSFCKAYDRFNEQFQGRDLMSDVAGQQEVLAALEELEDEAPASIKDDLARMVAVLKALLATGEDSQEALSSLVQREGKTFTRSSDRVTDYLIQVCGVDLSTGQSATTTSR